MNEQLFLQRYVPLTDFYLSGFWQDVSPNQMRQRPHPRVNSIAWNLWHITRCEDAGINRFVMRQTQVLDEGDWMPKLNLPWRHHGGDMTFAEVDELNQRINVDALQAYMAAVQARTRQQLPAIMQLPLTNTLDATFVQQVVDHEGLALRNQAGFTQNYTGWSLGKCLMTFALTHPFQHVGEMEVLASMLDINFT
jgi:uncharacterized damage-inducible protein DinB